MMPQHDQNPISEAAQDVAMKFAMETLSRIPKDDPEALEAHITAMLVLLWGALWGVFGTEYARDFIQAQLRGMDPARPHDVFTPPRVQ